MDERKNAVEATEVIGFDLGHGETALAAAKVASTREPQILDVHGQRSIITAVARHPERGILIGAEAFEARDLDSLRICFKSSELHRPDIRLPIRQFTGRLLEILAETRRIRGGGETHFFVGHPAGWSASARDSYAELFRDAGMRRVTMIPEPRAAFLYAREAGELHVSAEILAESVLIVDIGSSTTDFTAVQEFQQIPIDFGHNGLGAGLLDVALFRDTLRRHPERDRLREIFASHPEQQAKCELLCRRVKERYFSNESRWAEEPAFDTLAIPTCPRLHFDVAITRSGMEEIVARPIPELDGLSWMEAFRAELSKAGARIQGRPPQLVLLTGGGSRMGFTGALAEELFPRARVAVGPEPEFAIATGLALAGRIDLKTRAFRRAVQNLWDSGQVRHGVERKLPLLIDSVADVVAREMLHTVIKNCLLDWRGGGIRTLDDLAPEIQRRGKLWLQEGEGNALLARIVGDWYRELKPEIEKLTDPVCDRHQIARTSLVLPPLEFQHHGDLPDPGIDYDQMSGFAHMSLWVGLIGAGIIAKILGGGGTLHLLMAGPVGLILGFLVGAVAMVLGYEAVKDRLMASDLPLLTRKLVSEARIQGELSRKEPQFKEMVRRSLHENQEPFHKVAGDVTEFIHQALLERADEAALLIR